MASVMKRLTSVFNRVAMPIAASGLIPVWGVIEHRGRRSGRRYTTPVALTATADAFYVPLPYGEGTDWCRNVVAARAATIRHGGHDVPVGDPQVVSLSDGTPFFPRLLRPIIPLIGVKKFLRLRRLAAGATAA